MKINDILGEAAGSFWGGVAKGLGSQPLAQSIKAANASSTDAALQPEAPPADPAAAPVQAAPTNYNVPAYQRQKKQIPGVNAPVTPPAAPAPVAPQVDQQSKIGVGQINKIIPTLRTRDLSSVKKNVDAVLAKKAKPVTPAAEPVAAPQVDEPASIDGQKLNPNNPADAKILQQTQPAPAQPVSESVDIAEALWRKMKSKK